MRAARGRVGLHAIEGLPQGFERWLDHGARGVLFIQLKESTCNQGGFDDLPRCAGAREDVRHDAGQLLHRRRICHVGRYEVCDVVTTVSELFTAHKRERIVRP
ncbi:MAG: hypothetical protein ACJAQ3_000851 [Planctomycetota bacterium]|jgi:hypothetical protein